MSLRISSLVKSRGCFIQVSSIFHQPISARRPAIIHQPFSSSFFTQVKKLKVISSPATKSFKINFHLKKANIEIDTSVDMSKLPQVVFVLGRPGSGKGTQCSKIVEAYGFVHLSAGDLLREERNNPGSEYGELIEKHITDGTIVPVEITCSLIERAMKNSNSNLFLIDGFPRNQNNLDGWNKQMLGKANVLFVLFFDAPEEVCVERCLTRGQAGSGRSDDNPESLKKRVVTYSNDTMPIVNHFSLLNLVKTVDAAGNPEKVFEDVKSIFTNI